MTGRWVVNCKIFVKRLSFKTVVLVSFYDPSIELVRDRTSGHENYGRVTRIFLMQGKGLFCCKFWAKFYYGKALCGVPTERHCYEHSCRDRFWSRSMTCIRINNKENRIWDNIPETYSEKHFAFSYFELTQTRPERQEYVQNVKMIFIFEKTKNVSY